MPSTELDDKAFDKKLKRDAFGQSEPGEYEELRAPENIELTLSGARVLLAKIESQVRVAENKRAAGQEVKADWFLKLSNLYERLKPRVLEFEELERLYQARSIRTAIERHREKLTAAGGEPEAYDYELWAHAG